VRDALRFPLEGQPLEALVARGARATIVVEPPSLPIPGSPGSSRRSVTGAEQALTDPVTVTAGSASAHPRVTQTLAPNYLLSTRRAPSATGSVVTKPPTPLEVSSNARSVSRSADARAREAAQIRERRDIGPRSAIEAEHRALPTIRPASRVRTFGCSARRCSLVQTGLEFMAFALKPSSVGGGDLEWRD